MLLLCPRVREGMVKKDLSCHFAVSPSEGLHRLCWDAFPPPAVMLVGQAASQMVPNNPCHLAPCFYQVEQGRGDGIQLPRFVGYKMTVTFILPAFSCSLSSEPSPWEIPAARALSSQPWERSMCKEPIDVCSQHPVRT